MATMHRKITPMIHAKSFMIVPSVVVTTLFCHMIAPLYCRGEGRGGATLYLLGKGCCSNLKDLTLAIESRVPKTKPPFPKFEVMTHKKKY